VFESFSDPHARRLRAAFDGPDWREVVDSLGAGDRAASVLTPPKTASVFSLPVEQLRSLNEEMVRRMIAAGERDEERLVAALGTWPAEWPEDVPVRLSFVGLNLGFGCNMQPRCLYCNQVPVQDRLGVEEWKALIRSAAPAGGEGPYVSFTGGEPLLLGEALWGPAGLIETATRAGAACNVNTNALALTPEAAVGLVRAGLRRLHISLDSHRPDVQDSIHQCEGRWQQVITGLSNVQIAKTLLQADHPQIHLNCVLTRLNAADFPGFLRFVLGMKPLADGAASSDLDMHVIPVGGEQNDSLRLTADGYRRFFTDTWAAADAVWQEYQTERNVPEDKRGPLERKTPFMSPYHRVQQHGSLEEWAERAARGLPSSCALVYRCYVAPTQCFVLPNGDQYWCGGHTVSRPGPVGSVLGTTVPENIRRSISQMACVPSAYCQSCAGATLAINQSVEGQLRGIVKEWLGDE
jgi:sulfatase maturation enzyme AslB (radical SAM superfamily)